MASSFPTLRSYARPRAREPLGGTGANGGGHGTTDGEAAAVGEVAAAWRWRKAASAGARRASLADGVITVILLGCCCMPLARSIPRRRGDVKVYMGVWVGGLVGVWLGVVSVK